MSETPEERLERINPFCGASPPDIEWMKRVCEAAVKYVDAEDPSAAEQLFVPLMEAIDDSARLQ